ncbi:MAG: tRNA lysidine(34) synthetase TilS [Candidatus Omnitrophica bacterium]|nr:tRNA lysidine(34) synthetase TilS [Candidatus Omnitrophota bacterium]
MKTQLLKTAEKYRLFKKKDSIMLGVSGGPDSVALLYLFNELRQEFKFKLLCVHFNHLLRKEAVDEEKFVKKLAEKLKIPFTSERKNVGAFFNGDSLEQTARDLRYDFFLKVSRQNRIKKIALAHHKDDLVETVIMRFVRGAGLCGLRGFLPKTKYKQLTVIRPFIDIRKKEIVDWLKIRGIPYCVDKTNFEDTYLRNKIRSKLIPLIEEMNPNSTEVISSLAQTLTLDYDFLQRQAKEVYQSLKRGDSLKHVSLALEPLKKMHPALFNNVLRLAVEDLKGNTRRIERKHLEEIEDMIFNRPVGSVVHLPFLAVKKEGSRLIIQTLIS